MLYLMHQAVTQRVRSMFVDLSSAFYHPAGTFDGQLGLSVEDQHLFIGILDSLN